MSFTGAGPLPVTIDRDLWDYLALGATVLATVLAVAAIFVAVGLARSSSREAVRDRRTRFELEVLLDISRTIGPHTPGYGRDHARAARVALPGASLPTLQAWLDDLSGTVEFNGPALRAELEDAIRTRLHPKD